MGITKRQRDQMRDYIVAKLEAGGAKVNPRRKEILNGSGIETSYLLLGANEGVVVLVDQEYRNDALKRVFQGVKAQIPNAALVLYKNGRTFFRTAMGDEDETGIKSKRFKSDYGMSLKNYTDEELRRIISFRPEEEFVRTQKRTLDYYQPASERLDEGIVSFRFIPVLFDYSHIPSDKRFGPVEKESERLRIWVKTGFTDGPLSLRDGSLGIVEGSKS